jgi:hypothetical protein
MKVEWAKTQEKQMSAHPVAGRMGPESVASDDLSQPWPERGVYDASTRLVPRKAGQREEKEMKEVRCAADTSRPGRELEGGEEGDGVV